MDSAQLGLPVLLPCSCKTVSTTCTASNPQRIRRWTALVLTTKTGCPIRITVG
jgi:hypothetical protein